MADQLTAPDFETQAADYEMNGAVIVALNSLRTTWPLFVAPENISDYSFPKAFPFLA